MGPVKRASPSSSGRAEGPIWRQVGVVRAHLSPWEREGGLSSRRERRGRGCNRLWSSSSACLVWRPHPFPGSLPVTSQFSSRARASDATLGEMRPLCGGRESGLQASPPVEVSPGAVSDAPGANPAQIPWIERRRAWGSQNHEAVQSFGCRFNFPLL